MRLPGRKTMVIAALAVLLLLALGAAPPPAWAAAEDVGMFYDDLSQYGNWVDYGSYGPVWYPTQGVTQNWRPYVDGRWVPTADSWVFETGEPWGWATYHWGNWMPTNEYGWVWNPGSTWYPSTAAWRTSDDYIGWAPIPPPNYVPEPAYYPAGGYYPNMPALDLLSAPFWIFAQAANFLLGFGQPYGPAYSYYNTGYLAPYDYVPYVFANSLFLTDYYYPFYNHRAFYCFGPSFPFVSRVTNINITNINNFANNVNITRIRNGLPPAGVLNQRPFIRDSIPAAVRQGQQWRATRVSNPATVGRNLANPRVMGPPANVPLVTHEIPRGAAPQAGPAVRGRGPTAARGVETVPRGAVTTPRGEAAPRGVTTPRGEAAPRGAGRVPEVMPAPGLERAPAAAHRAPTAAPERRATTGEFRAPGRATTPAPTREFRAPSRGTTMPPPSTHELTPRMQQQIRQYRAPSAPSYRPSAPAPSFRPSAPAPSFHAPAPSAPAPRAAPSAPAPRTSVPAPAPAPHGGGAPPPQHK